MSFSTEGLAHACASHPKRTLGTWLVLVFVSFAVIALLIGNAYTSTGDVTSNPDSKQAAALIRDTFPAPAPSEIVVVRSDRYTVDDAAFQTLVRSLGAGAQALPVVTKAQSYYASHD